MSKRSRHNPSQLKTLALPVELTTAPVAVPLRRRWLLAVVLAALVISGESLWLARDGLLAQPTFRALATPLLAPFGYDLQRPHLHDVWQLGGLSLHAEAGTHDIWHVDAVLTNQASILQPWPTLRLSLRDWEGRLVARRVLAAADYLPADLPAAFAPGALIESGQPVRIRISVRIPADVNGRVPGFEQVDLRPLP